MIMSLEAEMKLEIKRLENELFYIEKRLSSLEEESLDLSKRRHKILQDMRILKLSLGEPVDKKEFQTSLYRLLKKKS